MLENGWLASPFLSLALLVGALLAAGIVDAAKPSNSLKSKGKEYREARVERYERTLKKLLAADPYPLIDLEVSLDEWKSAAGLIEGMDRAGRRPGRGHRSERGGGQEGGRALP